MKGHFALNWALLHLYFASVVAGQLDTSEVEGWNGDFRLKKDLHWISRLDPFISKLYRLQDTRFNRGALFKRDADDFQDVIAERERRAAGKGDDNADVPYEISHIDLRELPSEYKLYLKLDPDAEDDEGRDDTLRRTMASILNIPDSHVFIGEPLSDDGVLELAFLSADGTGNSREDYMPAKQVEGNIAASQLSDILPALHVEELYVRSMEQPPVKRTGKGTDKDEINTASVDSGSWNQAYVAYIVGGTAMVVVAFILLTVWCYVRTKRLKSEGISGRSSPSPPPHIPQQICLYPTTTPQVKNATLIQPDVTQIFTNKSCGECGTPVHTPPMKMKGKGLLERRHIKLKATNGRGSNASLTLDLGSPAPETKLQWGSPPKESTAEEYLLSAGNRMSRKQLRNCLRNTRLLYEEFWEIPMNHPDKVEVPGSGMKNRYRTIIPNERTRVVLPELIDDALSTYINANYIRGYAGEEKAFIATQGPMSHTVNDFWRAVWHVKAPIVVMITKLKEKNKTKCENYMPESGTASYGEISITVESIVEKEGYILRQLTLQYLNEHHTVLHYWYTAWPDHKAPNTARQLLELVKEVERHRCHPNSQVAKGPVVVHCSAGIGRTGCFIATSIGMKQLQEEHMVDILGIVCQMRLDRGGMVQTNEQYEFVHQALCLYERELPDRPPSGD